MNHKTLQTIYDYLGEPQQFKKPRRKVLLDLNEYREEAEELLWYGYASHQVRSAKSLAKSQGKIFLKDYDIVASCMDQLMKLYDSKKG